MLTVNPPKVQNSGLNASAFYWMVLSTSGWLNKGFKSITIYPAFIMSPCQISEIYVSGESSDLTAKEKLLLWSQQATEGYPGLRCVNFTSSWSDGRMFNALLHKYRSVQRMGKRRYCACLRLWLKRKVVCQTCQFSMPVRWFS